MGFPHQKCIKKCLALFLVNHLKYFFLALERAPVLIFLFQHTFAKKMPRESSRDNPLAPALVTKLLMLNCANLNNNHFPKPILHYIPVPNLNLI